MAELDSQLPVASTSALEPPPERATFASLGVEPFLCKALQAMAIRKPTAVQAACIPAILKGTPSPCPDPFPRRSGGRAHQPPSPPSTKQAPTVSGPLKPVRERPSHLHCPFCRRSRKTRTASSESSSPQLGAFVFPARALATTAQDFGTNPVSPRTQRACLPDLGAVPRTRRGSQLAFGRHRRRNGHDAPSHRAEEAAARSYCHTRTTCRLDQEQPRRVESRAGQVPGQSHIRTRAANHASSRKEDKLG
jgi:hypothetical protein